MTSYGFSHHGYRSFTDALNGLLPAFLTTVTDSSLSLVLLSKSSKSLDHMLRKEYTVTVLRYCGLVTCCATTQMVFQSLQPQSLRMTIGVSYHYDA